MQMSKPNKISIISATEFAKKIKRKWLIFSVGGILFAFIVIIFQGNSGNKKQVQVVQSEFKDLTPLNTDERQVLRDIQLNLREIKETTAKEQEAAKKRETEFLKQISKLEEVIETKDKKSQEQLVEYNKTISELKLEIESKPSQEKTTNKGVEIPSTKPSIPPPPPIYVDKNNSGSNASTERRTNLPDSNVIRTDIAAAKPIVLKGSEKGNNKILVGSSLEQATPKQQKKTNSYLPEGSFVNAVLLTAADFGAGKQTQSNPQPILLRLQTNATLPGLAKYKLRSCFAIATGYGELSSHRVYLQVTRLSCVEQKTGAVLSASVLGSVVDSDATLGLRGKVERREGMLLGKALLAGFAEGTAKIMGVAAQNSEQVITGAGVVTSIDTNNAAQMAGWAGFENAMSKLADRYIEEANQIFPVIEISPGRKASIFFQAGQNLEWKMPDE